MSSPARRIPGTWALVAVVLLGSMGSAPPPVQAGEPAAEEPLDDADDLRAPDDHHETIKIGTLSVSIWQPAEPGDAPLPLIVFSPGFTACSTGAPFLTSKLADAGYIVAAPDHKDSACAGGAFAAPEAPFGKPQAWSEKTYRQRGRDIGDVIDAMKKDPRWAPRIDAARVGLMGHSLGGHVVLALAGAFPSWQRADVKAVLACAPLIKRRLENVHVPVMYQAGGQDVGTTALIKKAGGAYDRTPEAAFVELKSANHFAWSGGGSPTLEEDIVAIGIAFFDAKLKSRQLARPEAGSVAAFKMK